MEEQRHVAVIPFPFTSHPISLFNITVRLARSSPTTRFSFLTTPKCKASLFNSDHINNIPSNIKPYNLANDLPETGHSLPDWQAMMLFAAGLIPRAGNFGRALGAVESGVGTKITCLIVDFILCFHAAETEIPWIAVWSPSPISLSIALHAELHRQGSPEAAELIPGLPGLGRVLDSWPSEIVFAGPDSSPFREDVRRMGEALRRASAVVLNSFREMYPETLYLDLESRLRTSVLSVGFHTVEIIPTPSVTDDLTTWLDGKKPKSVAYISFGTMIGLSDEELTAMTEALEEKGGTVSFLWSHQDRHKRRLPSGFVERSRRYGKIAAWVNQARVLRHASIGVHVTLCGMNSVNESIAEGVPIIGRPFYTDNKTNCEMIERGWKIGVEIEGGVFTRVGFVKALETVLESERGVKMRERALELKKLVIECSGPEGSGTRDFNAVLRLVNV